MRSLLLAALVPLFVTPNAQTQTIPAQFVNGRVLVTVAVNGKQMLLHLDSGTSGIVLDTGAARDAGLTVAQGETTADIDVGTFHASRAAIAVAPYGAKITGPHVSGLLGGPFFESNVVTIDYPHERVIVTPRSAFDPSTMHSKATALLELYHGMATVPVWIDGVRARMALDTGGAQTMAFRPFADRIGLNWPVRTSRLCTFGEKCFLVDDYLTGPLVVGTTEFRKALIDVPAQPLLSTKYYDGILGRDVLEQFAVTFDYADNAVYFSL
ncbi:MAG TPA: pepsin/retropepsin-like aspartic protease family protein [Candidatus Baltobacteraceae bacterium]|nr:pepsin/retropepsin-like aspartic protease family protein [Candidatus Baltobacteraceae bacterium]